MTTRPNQSFDLSPELCESIAKQSIARGFANIGDYLQHLVDEDVKTSLQSSNSRMSSTEATIKKLISIVQNLAYISIVSQESEHINLTSDSWVTPLAGGSTAKLDPESIEHYLSQDLLKTQTFVRVQYKGDCGYVVLLAVQGGFVVTEID